jgi:predicted secreted protein
MSWFTTGIIFVIVWWLVLFVVLPFGAQPLDSIQPGHAPSAPARPRIGLKMAITTVIAVALTAAVIWFLDSGLVQIRPA